jgi:hypothetical protein
MKYYTWKLKWEVNPATGSAEGTDPTWHVNNDDVRVEPQFYISNEASREDELYYAICSKGSLTPASLTDWSVTEITAAAMLAAAQTIDADVTMVDGFLVWPPRETEDLV